MPNCSRLTAFAARDAAVCAALLLAGAMGCAPSDATSVVTGRGGASGSPVQPGSAGSSGEGSGGMTNSGGSPGSGGRTLGSGGSTAEGSGGATGGASDASGSGGSGDNGASGGSGEAAGTGGTGAGTAGGSGHGGTAGATGGAAATGASCSSAKLCDDFETGTIDSATWKVSMNGQFKATVETAQHHSGTHAVHILAPNTANSAFITETKAVPADLWGRAWLRFTGPEGGHQVYIYVASGGTQMRVLNRQTGKRTMAINNSGNDKWYQTTTELPQDTWFCYEWHVSGSATTIYKDGMQLTTSPNPVPGLSSPSSVALGWQRWQTGSAAGELWIDDVAINDKQIGCQ